MGRIPCCEKDNVKRGQWTPEEDNKLSSYIAQHGTRNWRLIPKNAGTCTLLLPCMYRHLYRTTLSGDDFDLPDLTLSEQRAGLQRCGKSCRLRWTNYLRPDLKHGEFSESEEQTIVKLHSVVGNRWSLIAAQLPGRTDNDVKNHWNTKLKKKLSGMGIDPVTHKPFSHLMAEIATTLAPPQVAHLAEAALGCFKDEMLHLLSKKRIDFAGPATPAIGGDPRVAYNADANPNDDNEDTVQKIKLGLSRAIMQEPNNSKAWTMMSPTGEPADGLAGMCDMYPTVGDGFRYSETAYGNDADGSAWSQSLCTGSTCTGGAAEQKGGGMHEKEEDDDGEEAEGGKAARKADTSMFGSDCVLWDLSDDLMNPIV